MENFLPQPCLRSSDDSVAGLSIVAEDDASDDNYKAPTLNGNLGHRYSGSGENVLRNSGGSLPMSPKTSKNFKYGVI